MSLLSYTELVQLLELGVVHYADLAAVNSSSIDLTLGNKVLVEKIEPEERVVFIKSRERLDMVEVDITEKAFHLAPGQFCLAHSQQMFFLPNNISAEYKLKSSLARSGLEHLNAGWCDAGWNGSVLTLELKNMTQHHHLVLEVGMPIGQMVFFKHTPVPDDKSYAKRGRYNGDQQVERVKP